MIDPYRKISKITASYLDYFGDYTISDLEFIKGLNKIVLANDFSITTRKYRITRDLSANFNYAYDFMGSIKGTYADYLKKAWHNHTFHFKSNKIPSRATSGVNSITGKKEIIFPICNTIEDSYAITHEIMHDFNMDIQNHAMARNLITEAISICAEMLQEDYFARISKTPLEYKKNMLNDMSAILYKAVSVQYQIDVIEKYLIENEICYDNFCDIVESRTDRDIEIGNEVFNELIEKGELDIDTEQRYIIGILLASLMHQNILNNPNKINDFIFLNENINQMELDEVFNMFNLSLISENGNILKVEDTSLKILENAYIKEIKRRRL